LHITPYFRSFARGDHRDKPEDMMKRIFATAVLAALVASPALAQTARRAPAQQSLQPEQSYGRSERAPAAAARRRAPRLLICVSSLRDE